MKFKPHDSCAHQWNITKRRDCSGEEYLQLTRERDMLTLDPAKLPELIAILQAVEAGDVVPYGWDTIEGYHKERATYEAGRKLAPSERSA